MKTYELMFDYFFSSNINAKESLMSTDCFNNFQTNKTHLLRCWGQILWGWRKGSRWRAMNECVFDRKELGVCYKPPQRGSLRLEMILWGISRRRITMISVWEFLGTRPHAHGPKWKCAIVHFSSFPREHHRRTDGWTDWNIQSRIELLVRYRTSTALDVTTGVRNIIWLYMKWKPIWQCNRERRAELKVTRWETRPTTESRVRDLHLE